MSNDNFGMSRDTSETGMCRKTIMIIDASLLPSKNNRSAKLGSGNQTFASAVRGYDPFTKRVTSGDGTGSTLNRYPFEPDNWVHRKHEGGFDLVWAVRLTVDRTNKAQENKNRSTHVIDQGESQRYGNFADMFWICKTGADTDFSISGAGYASEGGGSRDALALSCAENEGFISDGDKFGQLAHILTFLDPEKPDVPTPGGPGGTPTPGGGGRPPIPTTDNTNGFQQQSQGTDIGIQNTPPGQISVPPPGTTGIMQPGNPGSGQPDQPPPDQPPIPNNDPLRTGRF